MSEPIRKPRAPRKQDRAKYREKDRAYEARRRERGDRMVTVRLGINARERIKALCEQHACNVHDLIEGLLFGNVPTPNPYRLSPYELEFARAMGGDPIQPSNHPAPQLGGIRQ